MLYSVYLNLSLLFTSHISKPPLSVVLHQMFSEEDWRLPNTLIFLSWLRPLFTLLSCWAAKLKPSIFLAEGWITLYRRSIFFFLQMKILQNKPFTEAGRNIYKSRGLFICDISVNDDCATASWVYLPKQTSLWVDVLFFSVFLFSPFFLLSFT